MENEKINSKGTEENKEKEGIFWNSFWFVCILLSIVLISISCFFINDFNNDIRKYNLKYRWPELTDLIPSLYLLPMIICYKLFIEYLSKDFVEYCLSKKYKHPKLKELKDKYRLKLSRHLYKITFYTGITIFGYYVLKDLPYFPKSMGGKGYMPAMFLPGFPNSYFHEKPPLFDFYYNLSLAYFVCDFIFLFISEKKQSDFINMLLHHICTISLIIFSHLVNYSNVGSIVLFLHLESDIFVHLTRFLLQTDAPEIIKDISGIVLVFNFLYVRVYVLGDIIYVLYNYITWKGVVDSFLLIFLSIIYLMHINWAIMLVQKMIALFMGTKLYDTREYCINKEKIEKKNSKKTY